MLYLYNMFHLFDRFILPVDSTFHGFVPLVSRLKAGRADGRVAVVQHLALHGSGVTVLRSC